MRTTARSGCRVASAARRRAPSVQRQRPGDALTPMLGLPCVPSHMSRPRGCRVPTSNAWRKGACNALANDAPRLLPMRGAQASRRFSDIRVGPVNRPSTRGVRARGHTPRCIDPVRLYRAHGALSLAPPGPCIRRAATSSSRARSAATPLRCRWSIIGGRRISWKTHTYISICTIPSERVWSTRFEGAPGGACGFPYHLYSPRSRADRSTGAAQPVKSRSDAERKNRPPRRL